LNITSAQAKTVNFSICYGGKAESPKDNLGLGFNGLNVAQQILDEMKGIYPGLFVYFEGVTEAMERSPEGERYVKSIRGRRRGFSHLGDLNNREGRQAANAVVQMLEADVFKKIVLELDKAFKQMTLPVEILLLLHDGIWLTCPEKHVPQTKMLIKQVMQNSLPLSIPLVVDFDR